MKVKKIFFNTFIVLLLTSLSSQGAVLDYLSPADPLNPETVKNSRKESIYSLTPQKVKLTQNYVRNHYEIGMQKFMQANVKSAYRDFELLIQNIVPNDYAYLRMADEMAEIGLFNLSNEALNHTSDKDISYVQADDIRKFYFPKNMPEVKDEIYLAEVYSNIMYNAQGKEATAELVKKTSLMEKSDYANYIAALGSLKTDNTDEAEKYINKALKINPDNISYQKLKIEISLQKENSSAALKILANIEKETFSTANYKDKIDILKEYVLYKTEKNDVMKKYHLASYYYLQNENAKALRTLQTAISTKKKYNKLVYALMSAVYYNQKEYEKAQSFADKSIQLGGGDKYSLMVLGKVNYRNQNYKEAIKNFKSVPASNDTEPQVWTAMAYSASGNEKQAKEIYQKILKERSDCPEAYYNIALKDKDRAVTYYKKAVTANPSFIDGWAGLAKSAIDTNNLTAAGKYLEIVKYIDENDFRYYYYQGLVYKAKGLHQDANYYFKRSLAINPDNEPAKKELGI